MYHGSEDTRVKHPVNNIVLILSAHLAVQNEYLTWNKLIVLDKFFFAEMNYFQ